MNVFKNIHSVRSVHWVTASPAILSDDWSRNEYVRYLALRPGLSHLPSPLKQQLSELFTFFIPPCSFNHASFATYKRYLP